MKIKGKKAKIYLDGKLIGTAEKVEILTTERRCNHCNSILDHKGECYRCFMEWVNLMCN